MSSNKDNRFRNRAGTRNRELGKRTEWNSGSVLTPNLFSCFNWPPPHSVPGHRHQYRWRAGCLHWGPHHQRGLRTGRQIIPLHTCLSTAASGEGDFISELVDLILVWLMWAICALGRRFLKSSSLSLHKYLFFKREDVNACCETVLLCDSWGKGTESEPLSSWNLNIGWSKHQPEVGEAPRTGRSTVGYEKCVARDSSTGVIKAGPVSERLPVADLLVSSQGYEGL